MATSAPDVMKLVTTQTLPRFAHGESASAGVTRHSNGKLVKVEVLLVFADHSKPYSKEFPEDYSWKIQDIHDMFQWLEYTCGVDEVTHMPLYALVNQAVMTSIEVRYAELNGQKR